LGNYILRRLTQFIPVLFGITVIVFLLLHLIPGDPCRLMRGKFASDAVIQQCRDQYYFDKPVWFQYIQYMSHILKGDFGQSLLYHRPVLDIMKERLPVTVFLAIYSILLSILVSLPVGIGSALRKDTILDQGIRSLTTIFLATPSYVIGLLLMLLLSIYVHAFPASGYGTTFPEHLWHLFLPALTIAFSIAPLLARTLRASLLEILGEDYIRTAKAKGLHWNRVFLKHALSNALVSFVSLVGLNLAGVIGGVVVVEQVFSVPGIGSLLLSSIFNRDFDIVQSSTLVFALMVVIVNLLTDLTYPILDPRVHYD
jgi:ABC-type dipeptide/oligopeptide/nickel transport system permease component